jgi:hypothetical protein
MVRIVDIGPDPKVVKHCTCENCGAKLEYVKRDVKNRRYSCMGESDTLYYIECPNCNYELRVRGY